VVVRISVSPLVSPFSPPSMVAVDGLGIVGAGVVAVAEVDGVVVADVVDGVAAVAEGDDVGIVVEGRG
jgi:hypothetical protein